MKLLRFVTLLKNFPQHEIRLNVDTLSGVVDLSNAAAGAKVIVKVCIELNIGHNRTGIDVVEDVLPLALDIRKRESLQLVGICGYEGHTPVLPAAAKEAETVRSHAILKAAKEALVAAGFVNLFVSAGGSSNYKYALAAGVVTELQAGGAALCDKLYLDKAGLREMGHVPALKIRTTVVSAGAHPKRVSADAGFKHVGMHPFAGLPLLPEELSCWEPTGLSAEHLRMRPVGDCNVTLVVGQSFDIIPGYGDTFLNKVPQIYGFRNGIVEAVYRRE